MIVLTAGPASLARLMRRGEASKHLAPRQVDDHQDQGDQAGAAFTRQASEASILTGICHCRKSPCFDEVPTTAKPPDM
jgi:hypothetical protein